MHETRSINPNPEQRRAIFAPIEATLNVVAGAGTGKTAVLVDRYLKLVRDDGVAPERILALTFTLKAAAEMRHRVHSTVRERFPEAAQSLYGAWIMNFHQFGFRMIKDNAPALGIDPDVDVVSAAEFQRIRTALSKRFRDGSMPGLPLDFGGELPPPRKIDDYFKLFFNVAEKVRGDVIDVSSLRARIRETDHAGYRAWIEAIIAVAHAYEEELRLRNLIDFSDMITTPARGLEEQRALRDQYVGRFDHILVDEFQDTSEAQNAFIRILSGGSYERVTVVGDDKQSIYRWRDARVENLREFPGDPEPLRQNFRSYQRILDLAHDFISSDPGFAGAIQLEAARGDTSHPIVLFHPEADDKNGRESEAEALAIWVRTLTEGIRIPDMAAPEAKERLGYEDVTILLRSMNENYGRPQIEAALERHGIPYALIGGANAGETQALELLHAWLSLLLAGTDDRELIAVLERGPLFTPDAAIRDLFRRRVGRGELHDRLSPQDVSEIEDVTARTRLETLREVRDHLLTQLAKLDFHEFIDLAVQESPVLLVLAAQGVSSRAVDDVLGEVHDMIDTLSGHDELNLPTFLEHLRVAVDEKKFRDEGDIRFPRGRVRIMTMHQSKGLEFPAVAVAGIKPPPKRDRFFVSRDDGVFFSARDKAHWERSYDDTEDKEREDRMTDQEARCLLYVSMTRARDFLWVSSPLAEGGKTHFAGLLAYANEREGVHVLRTPPKAPAAAERREVSPESVASLEFALNARSKHRAALAAETVPVPPLQFVTWRGLQTWSDCPLQYSYRFIRSVTDALAESSPSDDESAEKPDEPIGKVHNPKGVGPREYGVFVHEALRASFSDPDRQVADVLSGLAERFGFTGKVRDETVSLAGALIDAVRSSEIAVPGENAAFEQPFQARLDRAVFHGIFDRVEKHDGVWRVIDYKVGTRSDDHSRQVAFYAWALERITGEGTQGSVCYVRADGVALESVDGAKAVADVEKMANRLDASLASGKFEATPGDVCGKCAYRSICPHAKSQA